MFSALHAVDGGSGVVAAWQDIVAATDFIKCMGGSVQQQQLCVTC